MLQSVLTDEQWQAADEKYGVFFNTDSREIEIWPNIVASDPRWVRVAEMQNPVQFLGFIDVDTAITREFEVIIETLKYEKQQQEEQAR